MKFRKKPVVIDAVQWKASKQSWDEILAMGCPWNPGEMGSNTFTIPTLEGEMLASEGDWIIKGVNGEFYPCKPDIFEKTYEPCSPHPKKEEVESQHKFWKDRNPPQCLHCGKTEQELAKESTTNLQKIDNQLVDSPTKVDKENTIDSDIDCTSKSPMFKALEKAFMESYCFHQKKNNEACSDCGRMRLKAK